VTLPSAYSRQIVATLQLRNDSYRVLFCSGGRRYPFTIGKVSPREAENTAAVDQVLLRIEQRLLRVPDGADLVEFVKNGGQLPEETDPAPEPITLRRFQEQYLETHRGGAMEKNSFVSLAALSALCRALTRTRVPSAGAAIPPAHQPYIIGNRLLCKTATSPALAGTLAREPRARALLGRKGSPCGTTSPVLGRS
jgi:hypothetical protein